MDYKYRKRKKEKDREEARKKLEEMQAGAIRASQFKERRARVLE